MNRNSTRSFRALDAVPIAVAIAMAAAMAGCGGDGPSDVKEIPAAARATVLKKVDVHPRPAKATKIGRRPTKAPADAARP